MNKYLKRKITAITICIVAGIGLGLLAEFSMKGFAIGTIISGGFLIGVMVSCFGNEDIGDYFNF